MLIQGENSGRITAMPDNMQENYNHVTNEVVMLAINTTIECKPGSHKAPRVYSVSPAVSSRRRPMSDPSGERMALTDAFLMFLIQLAIQGAICLSWVSVCLMDTCWRLEKRSERNIQEPRRAAR